MKYAETLVCFLLQVLVQSRRSALCLPLHVQEQGRVGTHDPDFQTPMVPVISIDPAGNQKQELLLPLWVLEELNEKQAPSCQCLPGLEVSWTSASAPWL